MAQTIKTALHGQQTFRFCISPTPFDEFPESPALEPLEWEAAGVHRDEQGMLRMRKRNFSFRYDPPTGTFKLTNEASEIISGKVRAGNYLDSEVSFNLQAGDCIYGLGEASGQFNRNNQSFRLLNLDTLLFSIRDVSYASFPFFIIRRDSQFIGLFLNCSFPMQVSIDNSEKNPEGPAARFHIMSAREAVYFDIFCFSGTLPEIIKCYATVTGHTFLPPLWALGFHQSRWSYKSAERVLEIARRFRSADLPCDAIHLDIHYMQNYKVFTWNSAKFQNPEGMHARLGEQGIRTVAIVDPGVKVEEGYKTYEQGRVGDYYCKTNDNFNYQGKVWPGIVVFPDFTRPEVQHWWGDCHQDLFNAGVSGIWNDMNDPVLWMNKGYDPLEQDIKHARGSHRKNRNLYASQQAAGTAAGFKRHLPGRRQFILTRSAFCGIQKHAAVWTGDNHSTWEHLKENMNMVINLGLSGVPFSGADVGGFASGPGARGVIKIFKNRELFSRWMELGSLMPFFRVHTALLSFQQEPWSFGQEVLAISRKHMKRRYRLLPYIYQLAHQAHQSGQPLVRPLFYQYPELEKGVGDDQFMLGENLLAAPIFEKGQRLRQVFLPQGQWVEFETGKIYAGNAFYELETTPGFYPLFVRAGAILPVCQARRNAEDSLNSELILEVYPADAMQGSFIFDDFSSVHSSAHESRLEGIRAHNGDLKLERRTLQDSQALPFQNLKIRVPLNYRILNLKGQRAEGDRLHLAPEDRNLEMQEFTVPADFTELEFPYISNW